MATLVVEKAAALVLVVALARTLSPDDFGRYAFVVAYLSLFQVLADFGLETTLLRRLAQSPDDRGVWLSNALGLRLAFAVAATLLAVVIAPLSAPDQVGIVPLVALGAAGLLWFGHPVFRAFLRAELRLDRIFWVALATQVALFGSVAAVLAAGGSLAALFLAISAAHLVGLALAALVVRRATPVRLSGDGVRWRQLAQEAWPLGANQFVLILGLRIGPLFLMTFAGPIAVGYFSTSMRLAEALNLAADGLMLAVFPLLAAAAGANGTRFEELSRGTAKLLAVVLCSVALVLSEASPLVLGLLFGTEFVPAAPALTWLAWGAVLAGVGTVYSGMLIAHGLQRALLGLHVGSAVFQVALQYGLVSRFGVVGAAAGVVIASAVNHAVLIAWPRTRSIVRPCARAVGPILAVAVLTVTLLPVVPGAGLTKGLLAATAFLGVVFGARLVGRADVDRLRSALGASPDGSNPPAPSATTS